MKLAMVGVAVGMGCATPYQPTGVRGGFTENQIGPGAYAIQVHVNAYTSMSTAVTYAYRRAGEICPSGFNVIDGTKSQRDNYTISDNTISNAPKSDVSLIVQCKESTVETLAREEARDEAEPRQARARPKWWCSRLDRIGEGPRLSSCTETRDECVTFREAMLNAGHATDECAEHTSAACYSFRGKDGDARRNCLTTTAACQTQLEYTKSSGGEVLSECETK